MPDMPFAVDLALNALPGLLVMQGRLHGTRNTRTRAMVEDGTDDAVLLINLEGPHLIEQGGRDVLLGDGEAVLISGSDPSSFSHKPPGKILGLRLPKTRLVSKLAEGDRSFMRKIPTRTPALNLLRHYLDLSWNAEVGGHPSVAPLMVDQLVDLMAVAMGATDEAAEISRVGGLRAARLSAVKKEIAARLQDPELSLPSLAQLFHCTPRSLQRLFEGEGTTFTQYLLEQRLALAHGMLRNPQFMSSKISTVGFDCGFGDVSYFNRTFRRHFGASPSEIRQDRR